MEALKLRTYWVLIHAEFSTNVSTKTRKEIYACLKKAHWDKIHTAGIDVSTTWICQWNGKLAYYIKKGAVEDFLKCSPKGVIVKLVVHAGITKPTVKTYKMV